MAQSLPQTTAEPPSAPRPPATPAEDLAELRSMAMGLIRLLHPLAVQAAQAQAPEAAQSEAAQSGAAQSAGTAPLLASGGVIANFTALARLVIRIVEQERRISGTSGAASHRHQADEQPVGQKLLDELARIAKRRGPAEMGDETYQKPR